MVCLKRFILPHNNSTPRSPKFSSSRVGLCGVVVETTCLPVLVRAACWPGCLSPSITPRYWSVYLPFLQLQGINAENRGTSGSLSMKLVWSTVSLPIHHRGGKPSLQLPDELAGAAP